MKVRSGRSLDLAHAMKEESTCWKAIGSLVCRARWFTCPKRSKN